MARDLGINSNSTLCVKSKSLSDSGRPGISFPRCILLSG